MVNRIAQHNVLTRLFRSLGLWRMVLDRLIPQGTKLVESRNVVRGALRDLGDSVLVPGSVGARRERVSAEPVVLDFGAVVVFVEIDPPVGAKPVVVSSRVQHLNGFGVCRFVQPRRKLVVTIFSSLRVGFGEVGNFRRSPAAYFDPIGLPDGESCVFRMTFAKHSDIVVFGRSRNSPQILFLSAFEETKRRTHLTLGTIF